MGWRNCMGKESSEFFIWICNLMWKSAVLVLKGVKICHDATSWGNSFRLSILCKALPFIHSDFLRLTKLILELTEWFFFWNSSLPSGVAIEIWEIPLIWNIRRKFNENPHESPFLHKQNIWSNNVKKSTWQGSRADKIFTLWSFL